jgi:glycosyltransferase involved in cell wall biosynthesis
LRVLTFNSHQPYLHLLASSLPWTFGIITPRLGSGNLRGWDSRIRPLPINSCIYSSAQEALQANSWDWILTHNVHDLLDVKDIALPKAFLVHGTLSGRIMQDRSNIDRTSYIKNLQLLLAAHGARVVYISELKRKDWGMPGDIIRPAVDNRQYGGYRGNIRGILQVCNNLKARGTMMGWETYQAVCRDLPNLVLGENGNLPSSRVPKDWDDLKEHLQSFRVYLYTPAYPYEDGYNLALLEAMATGMPVATLQNDTSPIRDGSEGVVGSSAEDLREKVLFLLDNPSAAIAMGESARATVEREFPVSAFREAWESFASKLVGK